jgi:hypothetical protein
MAAGKAEAVFLFSGTEFFPDGSGPAYAGIRQTVRSKPQARHPGGCPVIRHRVTPPADVRLKFRKKKLFFLPLSIRFFYCHGKKQRTTRRTEEIRYIEKQIPGYGLQ